MRPRYLADGTPPPGRSLAVDGAITSCDACYSHWPGAPAPDEIVADTATAILLRASRDPDRWLDGFDWCCIDHVDADGLLSMALACRPELAVRHGPLMVAAAAYGDFDAWNGEAGARLALRLHQLVRDERARGGGWEQRCCEHVVDACEELVAESAERDPERDAQIDQILTLRSALLDAKRDPPLRFSRDASITIVAAAHRHGHHPTGPTTVHQPDDCPPWVLDGLVPAGDLLLIALEREDGSRTYQLDAPHHSWAHTVRLPRVAWPDCTAARDRLEERERPGVHWVSGPAARARGFTCLLATLDEDGAPAASRQDPESVVRILAAHGVGGA